MSLRARNGPYLMHEPGSCHSDSKVNVVCSGSDVNMYLILSIAGLIPTKLVVGAFLRLNDQQLCVVLALK